MSNTAKVNHGPMKSLQVKVKNPVTVLEVAL